MPRKKVSSTEFVRVGYIGVDSGQVMLIDPCYIKSDFDGDMHDKPGLNYAGACRVTLSDEGCGNFGGPGQPEEMAFATRTAYGDGLYPVYIRRDADGRVAEMSIRFMEGDE